MRILAIVIGVALTGCGTEEPASNVVHQALTDVRTHWMVGTWDCTTNYHKSAEAQIEAEYTAKGTYTAVEYELDPGLVTGQYREEPHPVYGAINWDDRWEISDRELKLRFNPINLPLPFETNYTQLTTPDSARQYAVDAFGGVRVTNPDGSGGDAPFGALSLTSIPNTSTITIPFQDPRHWGSTWLIFVQNGVPHLVFDGRVQLDGRTGIVAKIYAQSDCVRREQSVLETRSAKISTIPAELNVISSEVRPQTVCIPQQLCNPLQCMWDPTAGWWCWENPNADVPCETGCGRLPGTCYKPPFGSIEEACVRRCEQFNPDRGFAFDQCVAVCGTNFQTTCQLGSRF